MNSFDEIQCEEYFAVYEEQAEFQAWMEAVELDQVNQELRELAAQ